MRHSTVLQLTQLQVEVIGFERVSRHPGCRFDHMCANVMLAELKVKVTRFESFSQYLGCIFDQVRARVCVCACVYMCVCQIRRCEG